MLEDAFLIRQFRRGRPEALQRIYEKYRTAMLTVATALCNDVHAAEDIVQDCFLSFARTGSRLRTEGSLKGYLLASVVNRVRDRRRAAARQPLTLDSAEAFRSPEAAPETAAICNEQMQTIRGALEQLPPEQREVVVLYTRARMTFREIAGLQNASLPTVQSRYRYGLDKLRVLLNGELEP